MKQLQYINSDDVFRINFSDDGSRFLAVSRDGNVISYLINGKIEGPAIKLPMVFDAAYVGLDRAIICARIHNHMREVIAILALYNLKSGHLIHQVEISDTYSVCVDMHRKRILVASLFDDGKNIGGYLETYDFNLKRLTQFKSNESPFDMVISHSGNHVAISSVYFELWDTANDPYPRFQNYPPPDGCTGYICEVNSVDITPDGRYALGGLYGGKAACFLVKVSTGKIIGWYGPDGTETFVDTSTVALSPDGKYIAIAIRDKPTVDIYRVSDNTIFHQFEASKCRTIAFSPQGDILAIGGMNDITLWQFIGEY